MPINPDTGVIDYSFNPIPQTTRNVYLPAATPGAGAGGGTVAPSTGIGSGTVGDPGLFKGAVETQAADYDRIMKGYQDLLGSGGVTPTTVEYQMSPYQTSALDTMRNLAETGGYSPQGIQDIRERSISPIRSIYANAQENLQRQKALQGGYSPNLVAATTKMARQLSDQIGGITTNVNAGIAQNVAANKLSIAPSFAGASQAENNARMQTESHNADVLNAIAEFNAGLKQNALEGMRGLYGTTPALASMFGDQALRSRGLDINQQQVGQGAQEGLMRILAGVMT